MLHLAKLTIALVFVLASAVGGLADETSKDSSKLNVKADGVKKFEANQTQIGFSSTRVFYTLADQQAVVMIHINNKSDEFPLSGTVYQFAPDVTADGLAKWLNNQHSDGLFPEVPEPVATHKLPADSLKTVSSKLLGEQKGGFRNDTYQKYTVEFAANETKLKMDLTVAAFKDSATVYMKAN